MGNKVTPKFYVSMAPADNVGRFTDTSGDNWGRVSLTNLYPSRIKENLLFSMSYKSDIHYETMNADLDPFAVVDPLSEHQQILPRRVFADCGAYQIRNLSEPILPNGSQSNAKNAWEVYQERHLEKDYPWDEILLCAPDHMICEIEDYTKEEKISIGRLSPGDRKEFEKKNPPPKRPLTLGEHRSRMKFNRQQAKEFIKLAINNQRITPVAVIHGHCDFEKDIDTRKKNLKEMIALGYKYVALGGMVSYSNKLKKALKIIAGIDDLDQPIIAKGSILGRCREKGIRLHIFGLNSPDWCRWWYRLGIDSFDGSKLATEGARNGWYWVMKDGQGSGRITPTKPKSVSELYHRIAVRTMDAESWEWTPDNNDVLVPEAPSIHDGIDTSCQCPACQYLKSARCPSKECWLWKRDDSKRHVCEPRMMGSNEHNMGRAAHNAFVFDKLLDRIEELNQLADSSDLEGENAYLKHWTTIEVGE